jgi:hypothetical protein
MHSNNITIEYGIVPNAYANRPRKLPKSSELGCAVSYELTDLERGGECVVATVICKFVTEGYQAGTLQKSLSNSVFTIP